MVAGWTTGAGLGAERFRATFFGAEGSARVAARAQGQAGGAGGGGAPRGGAQPGTQPGAPGGAAGGRGAASPEEEARRRAAQRQRNIENLARVIHTEARGNGRDAMVAVGHTIRNRMLRNGKAEVDKVWGGYRHGARTSDEPGQFELAKQVAAGIIDGTTADPTGGATHTYSPQGRTTAPVSAPGQGNKAGFETVPGVIDLGTGQPGQNTFPDWSRSSDFEARPMPGIPERSFRFYRQKKEGRVR